jgi:hypothetical protein
VVIHCSKLSKSQFLGPLRAFPHRLADSTCETIRQTTKTSSTARIQDVVDGSAKKIFTWSIKH